MASKNKSTSIGKFKNRLSAKADDFLNQAKDKINEKVEGIKKPTVGVKLDGGTMVFITVIVVAILSMFSSNKKTKKQWR